MNALRVLHAPLHAPSARQHPAIVAREIRHHHPHSAGMTEAYGILPTLDKMARFRMVMETGGKDARRGQKDNPILVRRALRSLGSGQIHGADASTPTRIAPERWDTFSIVQIPSVGPVCHIALHPHAGVQDKTTGALARTDRATQFARQMAGLDAFLDYAERMDWLLVVTGDLNFRDKGTSAQSPYRILRNHKLDIAAHGLDCIASSKQLHLDVTEVNAPASITDHPWLLGTAA